MDDREWKRKEPVWDMILLQAEQEFDSPHNLKSGAG